MRILRLLLPLVLFIGPMQAVAQKYAYVDTDYILQHLPEYAEAQKELNSLANGWLDEIEEKYEAANQLEVAYRAERVLLTPEMRRKREDEIAGKRSEATEMQKAKFGETLRATPETPCSSFLDSYNKVEEQIDKGVMAKPAKE